MVSEEQNFSSEVNIAPPLGERGIIHLQENNKVYFSIYDKVNDKFYNVEIKCLYDSREDNRRLIIDKIIEKLEEIL